jgi:hypothetical protein
MYEYMRQVISAGIIAVLGYKVYAVTDCNSISPQHIIQITRIYTKQAPLYCLSLDFWVISITLVRSLWIAIFLQGIYSAADQDGKITPLQMMIETREPLRYLMCIPTLRADKVEALQFSENSFANCFSRARWLIWNVTSLLGLGNLDDWLFFIYSFALT